MAKLQTITIVFCLLCVAFASPASAQTTDPDPSSPSGATYEIPIETARDDAAPGKERRSRASKGVDGVSATPSRSTLRSENGFSSSSDVPGSATPVPSGSVSKRSGSSADSDRSKESGSRSGGAESAGSERSGGADPPPQSTDADGRALAAVDAPSGVRTWFLLGLAAVLGLGFGVAARVAARSRAT